MLNYMILLSEYSIYILYCFAYLFSQLLYIITELINVVGMLYSYIHVNIYSFVKVLQDA